jgi:hypothetical protein
MQIALNVLYAVALVYLLLVNRPVMVVNVPDEEPNQRNKGE